MQSDDPGIDRAWALKALKTPNSISIHLQLSSRKYENRYVLISAEEDAGKESRTKSGKKPEAGDIFCRYFCVAVWVCHSGTCSCTGEVSAVVS